MFFLSNPADNSYLYPTILSSVYVIILWTYSFDITSRNLTSHNFYCDIKSCTMIDMIDGADSFILFALVFS